jgi:hypothetical protein
MDNKIDNIKKTGKNIPIAKNYLINMTIRQLANYDSLNVKERKSVPNPYTDLIFMKLKNGKMIQIPRHIQRTAIVEWNMMKERELTNDNFRNGHTRVSRNRRYSQKDPNIMNKEISGANDEIYQDDVPPPDNELRKLRLYEKMSRLKVGRMDVSDGRSRRNNTYGDLPRDFEIYDNMSNQMMDRAGYADHPRMNEIMQGRIDGNEYPVEPNDIDFRDRSRIMRRRDMRHIPRHYPDDVVGVETDGNDTNLHQEDEYEDIDRDSDSDNDRDIEDNDDHTCASCNHENDENDEDEYDEYDYYDEHNEYVNERDNDKDNIENYDNVDNVEKCDDTAYKYLFFILLFIVIIVVIHYMMNNKDGKFKIF